jgi:membrane fusion protein (multidrug efflux system)
MNEMARVTGEDVGDGDAARSRLGRWRPVLLWSVPVLLIAVGVWFWLTSGRTAETDNATVEAHVVSVAPEVTGRIDQVFVKENQIVKPGDRLFTIDQSPFRITLESAEAAIGNAKISVAKSAGDYMSKEADVGSKSSDVEKAREDFARQAELMALGLGDRAGDPRRARHRRRHSPARRRRDRPARQGGARPQAHRHPRARRRPDQPVGQAAAGQHGVHRPALGQHRER